MSLRNYAKRAKLWREHNGRCHWCPRVTQLLRRGPREGQPPLDMATIDHLDDRFSPERGRHPGKRRQVLACWECNNRRARESEAAQPIKALWKRAGHAPRMMEARMVAQEVEAC